MNALKRRLISASAGIIAAEKISKKHGRVPGAIAGIIAAKSVFNMHIIILVIIIIAGIIVAKSVDAVLKNMKKY